jgi:hypothetical protein
MWLAKNSFATCALALLTFAGSGTAIAGACGGVYNDEGYYATGTVNDGAGGTTTTTVWVQTGVTFTPNPCPGEDGGGSGEGNGSGGPPLPDCPDGPQPKQKPECKPKPPDFLKLIKNGKEFCKKGSETCTDWATRLIATPRQGCQSYGISLQGVCNERVTLENVENNCSNTIQCP